jgi:DMSO/TMAO reductase YedYZ molybdopterin-dependent catalytic subunit
MFRSSPLRSTWLTSVLGLMLLAGLPVVMLTGLLSNASYDPWLAGNVALQGRTLGPLDIYLFNWPAHPVWLYAVNQGIHVSLGLALIPVVLVKQWSVLPRLLRGPWARSPALALERISLIFLISGIFFELATGVLFVEYWVPFHFDFTAAHYYGAWVFFGALILHVTVKLPVARRAIATRRELLSPPAPAGGLSRRGLLGTVGAGSALLGVQGIAQDVGGPLRRLAFMLPRSSTLGAGPNSFPVNTTFASLGLTMETITQWRLRLTGSGGRELRLTREQLLAMPQHSYSLPIACREGWSSTQRWTGVRLTDLAAAVGMGPASVLTMSALDGAEAALAPNQVSAEQSLLALLVNDVPLSLDHGFPARVIVPAEIATNCLKWVDALAFSEAT